MSTKLNPKGKDGRVDHDVRLAGGYGNKAAKQDPVALLRRATMACVLWDNMFYESGEASAENIKSLVPQIDPRVVADITIEAKEKQKLRHLPLFLIVEMTKHEPMRKYLREVIRKVISRADMITDLLALYWKDGRRPIPKQMKLGLADAFAKFDEYQFAKYNRDGKVKLRDALRVCHAKAPQGKEDLYKKINEQTLEVPDTWEVALSKGSDKKETWVRLIEEGKLLDLAFLRNLKNMLGVKVPEKVIRERLNKINGGFLLPLHFFAAKKNAPIFSDEIEQAMYRVYSKLPKLSGFSVFVVDVSGSMDVGISSKSGYSRLEVACAMAMLAREQCESVAIYATAGSDGMSKHATQRLSNSRGFSLVEEICKNRLGGGGIYTRQCLEYIKEDLGETPDRIMIFSDSQDCDMNNKIPKPFGTHNYIVDVSAHARGINYSGVWSAEISGWSEHFLSFIGAHEGLEVPEEQEIAINQ